MAGGPRSVLLDIVSRIAPKIIIRVEKDVPKFLWIFVSRNRDLRLIKISMPTKTDKLLSKFGLSDEKAYSVSIHLHMDISALPHSDEKEFQAVTHVPYKELAGSILHLCNTTRPNIAFDTTRTSYSNASHAGDRMERKFTSGYLFKYCHAVIS